MPGRIGHGSIVWVDPKLAGRAEVGFLRWVFLIQRFDIGCINSLRVATNTGENKKQE